MKRINDGKTSYTKKSKTNDEFYGFDETPDIVDSDLMVDEAIEGFTDEANNQDESDDKEKWKRKMSADEFSSSCKSICFHWLDIDMTTGSPLSSNPDGSEIFGSLEGPVPLIRMYGVTQNKMSIMATIHGFTPYFFVSLPAGIDCSDNFLGQLRVSLDQKMKEKARGEEKKIIKYVLGIERSPDKQSLLGYHFNAKKEFLKIYVAMPSLVPGLKRIFDEGIMIQGCNTLVRAQTYESNVPFILRFMIDNNIYGADWIELKEATYSIREKSQMVSRCNLEIDVVFNNLIVHPSIGPWCSIAPLRILSFDIECQGRKGHFPEAQFDPVIQIANTVTLQGCDEPFIKNVFTLNSCLPIVGAQVICSETEAEMFMKWRSFLNMVDPDILTGYNIMNFDIPYLLNRAKVYKLMLNHY